MSAQPHTDTVAKFRAFMVIWVAQLIARIGNGLTAFGLGVHVYQQSGLTTSVALVTMAAFLPSLLLGPLGGVLADRFDRRLLMILGDSFSALGLLGMLLAFHTGTASVVVLCLCAAVSSVFSSVMDPAYRATVTDLLTPEQYARAGGLVQLAAASQYLISPAVAGLLMAAYDITVVVTIDIATMVVTTSAMVLVWRTVRTPRRTPDSGFWADFRQGCRFLGNSPGIMTLMLLLTLVTFCMGFLQTLLTPMLLDLSDETTLGVVRSVAAVGMVVASLIIGVFNMKGSWIAWIAWCLVGGGVVVFFMGAIPNVLAIGVMAFGFFLILPPLNTAVEVLVRSAIPNDTQGKVWGLMGLISQLGYIVAYAVSGFLADHVFNPLLRDGGALTDSVGALIGVGESRGIGLILMVVGVLLVGIAALVPRSHAIRSLAVQSQKDQS
ncbi:MAG: MFS transporter [Propionibacteriaceae bacterium]|nr:MFS transporter [Propionibacteriaceae bacterium]